VVHPKIYRYPPLWGPDSYNHGAGMNRLIKASQLIKGNMPLGATAGQSLLTDEEVYDVAAFVNRTAWCLSNFSSY
jgi:thiosulfate dehydrogenase